MNETQELLADLRRRGWTWAAVADELGVHRNAIDRWARGERVPQTQVLVNRALTELTTRDTVPKQKRYSVAEPAPA